MSVPICNHFYIRRANNGRITPFKEEGVRFFRFLVQGTPLTQRHKIVSQYTRDSRLSYGKTQSLYLTWSWNGTGLWQTVRWTDRQNCHSYTRYS